MLNTLSQVTLKLTMPGVPDIYQGSELWDLAFVDPDNRRPVDFCTRAKLLDQVKGTSDWQQLIDTRRTGAIKLALLQCLLDIRRNFSELFEAGDYKPLPVRGDRADHVIAFARTRRGEAVIIVVGRLFANLTDGGRSWPQASAWRAELAWDGYDAIELLGPLPTAKCRDHANLSALFEMMPIAILRAKIVG